MAATPIPATTSRPGCRSPVPVTVATVSTAATAPSSAPSGTGTVPGNARATRAAPALAPQFTPMTSGLPSGLRVTDWNRAPAMPSAAPTPMATVTRGPLNRWRTNMWTGEALPVSTSATSVRGIPSFPRERVATTVRRRAAASSSAHSRERRWTGSATAEPTRRFRADGRVMTAPACGGQRGRGRGRRRTR